MLPPWGEIYETPFSEAAAATSVYHLIWLCFSSAHLLLPNVILGT